MNTGQPKVDARSRLRLAGVHPSLVAVLEAAASSKLKYFIVEGLRTLETQKEYVRTGKSKTLKSKHLTGRAVDVGILIDRKYSQEPAHYAALAQDVKLAAGVLGVAIVWGGDWKSFPDSVHFELAASVM